jgi:aminoglycoside 3-N-acetyltransferase
MNVTRAILDQQLRVSRIAPGDVLLFHSSLKAIGWIEPGPQVVIEALLDRLGASGTLVAPTLVPAGQGLRPLFDPATSPSEVGLLTEIVRAWPGAVRSEHPTHSVAAVGARAKELCADHLKAYGPVSPWGVDALGFNSPWDKLREWNAWLFMIGVDFTYCTILHHAQVRFLNEKQGVTWKDPWPRFDFKDMGMRLMEQGVVTRMKFGGADCLLARAGDVVENALSLLDREEKRFFPEGPAKTWLDQRRIVQSQGRLKAATLSVNVTPDDLPRPLARVLRMRGVILEDASGNRAAHVVWDHLGAMTEDADVIRQVIAESAAVPMENVLLTATHTHAGFWWPFDPNPQYLEFVTSRIREPIRNARSTMHDVRAGWRDISATGIARNRTVYLKDGVAYTERWSIPSTWHIPAEKTSHRGPEDNQLRLLVLEKMDGSKLAVMMSFSCHNSAGGQEGGIHDDFFGIAAGIVEAAQGCLCLVSPGSIGDQDPTALIPLGGRRDLRYAERLGNRLAGYALTALADVTMHDCVRIQTARRAVSVPVRPAWVKLAQKSGSVYHQRRAREGESRATVPVLCVGDYAMVGVPGELFTAAANEIRAASPFEVTSIASLTDGQLLYLPPKNACCNESMICGGCDDLYAMALPGSDRIIVEAAVEGLRCVAR